MNLGRNFVRLEKKYFDEKDIRVILDIGSRYGNESVALKQMFPNSKIYAFECNPDCIKAWKNNAKNKDIVLVEKAVSDVDGIVEFYAINAKKTITPHKDGNIGASSLLRSNPEYPYERYYQDCIKVPSTTIDAWARNNDMKQIDLVWIDLQGAELKAFTGMKDVLKNIKLIHTEIAFKPIYLGQPLFKNINTFFKKKNFIFMGFSNVSGWFGDADYINARYLDLFEKLMCRVKQLQDIIVNFRYHRKRLKQYFG